MADRFCDLTAFYETLYSSGILGRVLHPGGLGLTRRAVEVGGVQRGALVLDVASGAGGTVKLLTEEYGCRVVGLDASRYLTTCANVEAKKTMLPDSGFVTADGETLPFRSEIFDFVISECSFCLFRNKPAAVAEMTRTLKKGGKVVITDMTLSRNLQAPIAPLLQYACIAGAEDPESYTRIFQAAGLHDVQTYDCSEELVNTAREILAQKPELRSIVDALAESGGDSSQGGFSNLLTVGRRLLVEKEIGYAIIVGTK